MDGILLVATGLPIRIFNQVIAEVDGAAEAALEDAVAITRGRGDRFLVNLRVGPDDRLAARARRIGLVTLSDTPWMPGMALHPLTADALPHQPDHEIRQVTTAAGLNDHLRTAAAGFEMPERFLRAVFPLASIRRPEFSFYVGYTHGEPVSAGLGIRTGTTIGVYNIATLPSHRRRGYGALMTARVASDGAAAGCQIAVLQASDMGRPIYEALGYRTVVEYMGYIEPDPGGPPSD
jgi:GNAT superfamily N-acetyltransferase